MWHQHSGLAGESDPVATWPDDDAAGILRVCRRGGGVVTARDHVRNIADWLLANRATGAPTGASA